VSTLWHPFADMAAVAGNELVIARGEGVAVALEPERVEADPDLPKRLWAAARAHGLLTHWVPGGVALAPPLVIEDSEVDEIVGHLERALATL
jgi:adenosylmethionine-8-amino-7-oxononanoate aminotransferase